MIQVPASGFSRYVLDAAFLDAAGFRQAVGRVGVRVLAWAAGFRQAVGRVGVRVLA
jgi:hypothetical protein